MDRSVLIVEAPELDDESVQKIQAFLHELQLAFESNYLPQLRQQVKRSSRTESLAPFNEDEDPF